MTQMALERESSPPPRSVGSDDADGVRKGESPSSRLTEGSDGADDESLANFQKSDEFSDSKS